MNSQLERIGKYILLDHLADGGMATVYRAKLASLDHGPTRTVVIKKIKPDYIADDDFRKMFTEEIKVMLQLSHPSIVQLYEFGEENSQPYIVMEYVQGKSLREVTKKFKSKGSLTPIDFSLCLFEQIADGLGYAHSFCDPVSGDPLKIIHRDISPQNILVGYEGRAKLIDFGIAKSAQRENFTKTGTIKGKPSYMSPEQVTGRTLDFKSDQFAFGIVMWETLTGRKLFSGENELQILHKVHECEKYVIPPSKLRTEISPEMDQMVLQCLHKNPMQRFLNPLDLKNRITEIKIKQFQTYGTQNVSKEIKTLFQQEIIEEQNSFRALDQKIKTLSSHIVSIPESPHPAGNSVHYPTQSRDLQQFEKEFRNKKSIFPYFFAAGLAFLFFGYFKNQNFKNLIDQKLKVATQQFQSKPETNQTVLTLEGQSDAYVKVFINGIEQNQVSRLPASIYSPPVNSKVEIKVQSSEGIFFKSLILNEGVETKIPVTFSKSQ